MLRKELIITSETGEPLHNHSYNTRQYYEGDQNVYGDDNGKLTITFLNSLGESALEPEFR